MRRRKVLVADLLCGAGGSSTGCAQALAELGLEMELVCLNHSPVAIGTHSLNHPQARHYCQDISTVRPHIVVPEGYLDLLLASPTCTHHSNARGGKPTSDQQRSDPWHIITWLTELRVKRAIIENVWEFIKWGPVDRRTGRPIKAREGEYFKAWVDTIWRLGATSIEYRKLNAADYGEATTRQRFIMMIRFDRKRIVWPAPTHAKEAGDGLKRWRPAREIIDWSIKGKSIFGRQKPLVPKTLERIYDGAINSNWPEPFLVILRRHMTGKSIHGPLPTIAARGTHIGLAEPILIKQHYRRDIQGVDKPAPTATGVARIGLVEPVIISTRHGKAGEGPRPRNTKQPLLATITSSRGSQFSIAEPVILRHGENGGRNRTSKVSRPIPTVTTSGAGYLVEPIILNGRKNNRAARVSDAPVPTLETKGGIWLAEPFVLSQGAGGKPRSVNKPIPTAPTGGAHALVAPYYGSGSGQTAQSVRRPMPTVTSKARFGLVVPITHTGKRRSRTDKEPLPTLTGANRGELAFVEGVGGTPQQYDILYRMLEDHELAAAMGFDEDYKFTGNKTERIKQIGNAVSVRKMRACVRAIMADDRRARPIRQTRGSV